ncbi:MAG: penicillin-binding protein 2 [Oscillospiraceae bacterium]|jgi:cell division protein FtsI/penicillin-binding protein 2|nr:penicillin-binding protein 2 [Oscillospiraceae bacterium]
MLERRSAFLYFVLVALFVTSAVRLMALSSGSRTAATAQSRLRVEMSLPRGVIYDCNLNRLTNEETRAVAAVPPTAEAVAALRASLSPDAAAAAEKRLADGFPVLVTVPGDFSAHNIPVFQVYTRYSDEQLAAHIIGYLDGEGKGAAGLEAGYDDILAPSGKITVSFPSDARGGALALPPTIEFTEIDPFSGIALTLEKDLQALAERVSAKYIKSGAVAILEPSTGKIRAMVSLPGFSPNRVADSLQSSGSPFINRALSAYNVGSVFKLCVAAAALETGALETFQAHCNGIMTFADRTFACMNQKAHGDVQMVDALVQSCNIYFINLGQKIGADPIYTLAHSLGFGQSRRIANGILPDAGVLTDVGILRDQPSALANFSFGQGDLLATPLQIACMVASIADGGKSRFPTLLEGMVDSDGKLTKTSPEAPAMVLREATALRLKDIMIRVVESGSGKNAQPETGGAGGKTGTAETGWIKDGRKISQAWFAGFYPAEEPKYSIAVIMEDGVSGGSSAAPVFKEIADGIADLY